MKRRALLLMIATAPALVKTPPAPVALSSESYAAMMEEFAGKKLSVDATSFVTKSMTTEQWETMIDRLLQQA